MQKNRTCKPLEQYLSYLSVIKERSECTVREYRTDILMFMTWLANKHEMPCSASDFSYVDILYLRTITLEDMYDFIVYCHQELKTSAGTRARKIVSIRQF